MKNKRILKSLGVGLLIVIISSGIYFSMKRKTEDNAPGANYYLSADHVVARDIEQVIDAKGIVQSKASCDVIALVSGTVKAVNISVGDPVNTGDLLISMDTETTEDDIRDAELSLKQAELSYRESLDNLSMQNALKNAKDSLENEKKKLNDVEILYNAGAISKYDYNAAVENYETVYHVYLNASENVKAQNYKRQSLMLQVEASQNHLADLMIRKDKALISAPITGVITAIDAKQFEQISEGMTVARIETTDKLQIVTNIGEYDIGDVKIGQDAKITGVGNNKATYSGFVVQIGASAEETSIGQSTERSVEVIIALNEQTDFKPNFSAEVAITVNAKSKALTVPYEAIVYRDNVPYVFTVKENVAEQHAVALGVRGELYIEVIADDINVDDQILLEPPTTLQSGDLVRILGEDI